MPNVFLCGLTGFGNVALEVLSNGPHRIQGLCTRIEQGQYPYYPCEDIHLLAKMRNIPIFHELPPPDWFTENQIDGLVSVTFHKIIPLTITERLKFSLNVHPSLLPAYRGAAPLFWVLKNGESKTGWTVHAITPELDKGDIYAQCEVPILQETQGELRQKMSAHLETFLTGFFSNLESNLRHHLPQDESKASVFPRFNIEKHGTIPLEIATEQKIRHIRALLPWPGVTVNGQQMTDFKKITGSIISKN